MFWVSQRIRPKLFFKKAYGYRPQTIIKLDVLLIKTIQNNNIYYFQDFWLELSIASTFLIRTFYTVIIMLPKSGAWWHEYFSLILIKLFCKTTYCYRNIYYKILIYENMYQLPISFIDLEYHIFFRIHYVNLIKLYVI